MCAVHVHSPGCRILYGLLSTVVFFACVQYMFTALRDCVPAIKWSRHQESPAILLKQFEEEVSKMATYMYMYISLNPGENFFFPSLTNWSGNKANMYIHVLSILVIQCTT